MTYNEPFTLTVVEQASPTVTVFNPSVDDLGPMPWWTAQAGNWKAMQVKFANLANNGKYRYLVGSSGGMGRIDNDGGVYWYAGSGTVNGTLWVKGDVYDFYQADTEHTILFSQLKPGHLFAYYAASAGGGSTVDADIVEVRCSDSQGGDVNDNIWNFDNVVDNGDGTWTVPNTGTGSAPDLTFSATAGAFSQKTLTNYIPPLPQPVATLSTADQSGSTITVTGTDLPVIAAAPYAYDTGEQVAMDKEQWYDYHARPFGYSSEQAFEGSQSLLSHWVYDEAGGSFTTSNLLGS